MAHTLRIPVYGCRPPCATLCRIEELQMRLRAIQLERSRKPDKPEDFVCYEDSDDEEESVTSETQILNTSYNFVDFVRGRELGGKEPKWVGPEYGSRHILTHEMFKEYSISLNNVNKVFCSQWLSDRQVVFGTKCNKLMVYDVVTQRLDQIPSLQGRRDSVTAPQDQQCGIHSVQINPSKTLLATGARNSSEIAVYRLPTLDPVCVGEEAHRDWVFDMCWLDDQFLVSGSRDTRMALWRVQEDDIATKQEVPTYSHVHALAVKECKSAQKVRAVAFNKSFQEIAALSLNGYIHIWNAETFKQKLSRKLPSCQENVCLAVQDAGMYAIGCRSYTLLLDARTLQAVKKISPRYSGCGIRSASFQGNVLTIGTGVGILLFYDLRAGKYLESSINSSRTVHLKASKGWVEIKWVPESVWTCSEEYNNPIISWDKSGPLSLVQTPCQLVHLTFKFPDEEYIDGLQHIKYTPAIYTHCYDSSGTRLFTAGGPLPANLYGNYAGLWQ